MTIDYKEATFPWTLDETGRRRNYFAQNGGRFLTQRQRRRILKKARKVGARGGWDIDAVFPGLEDQS